MRSPSLFLAVLLVGSGCSIQHANLRPSQVNDGLRDLDADAQNPFLRDATRVQVAEVGDPAYDRFLQQAAEVHGTLVLSNVVMADSNDYLAKAHAAPAATPAVQGQPALTADQKAALKARADRLSVLGGLLASVPARSAELATAGQRLADETHRHFTGMNALKVPAVSQGMDDALVQLRQASDQAPKLSAQLEQTHQTLIAMLDDKPAAPVALTSSAAGSQTAATKVGKKKKAASATSHKKPSKG